MLCVDSRVGYAVSVTAAACCICCLPLAIDTLLTLICGLLTLICGSHLVSLKCCNQAVLEESTATAPSTRPLSTVSYY